MKTTKDTSSPGSPRTDELSAGASRGWLNWLSLGMLGAGGTADSSSFAGVISEDIIKVILYSSSLILFMWLSSFTYFSSNINQFYTVNFVGTSSFKIFVFCFQDIYEGTEFHPVSSAENYLPKENYYSLFVRLSVSQIVTTFASRQVLQKKLCLPWAFHNY